MPILFQAQSRLTPEVRVRLVKLLLPTLLIGWWLRKVRLRVVLPGLMRRLHNIKTNVAIVENVDSSSIVSIQMKQIR